MFRSEYSRIPDGIKAFKITASLFYSTPKQGHRTVLTVLGDFNGPVRMDMQAGIGASLAFVRDDTSGSDGLGEWLAVFPSEKKAYTHFDALEGQAALGIPLPFTLSDLARMVSGDFTPLVPSEFASVQKNDKGASYVFNQGPVGGLTLSPEGTPLEIQGPRDNPWTLELSRLTEQNSEQGPMYAQKMELHLAGGEKAVLRIKSRELKVAPWPDRALDLPVPEGVATYRLNPGKQP